MNTILQGDARALAGTLAEPVIRREWAMPSPNTFSIRPIARLLDRYLEGCKVIVDPFARNSKRGTITNDLNPDMHTMYHMEAGAFCGMLLEQHIVADAVLFDPPYSPRQMAEVYQKYGLEFTTRDSQRAVRFPVCKNRLARLLRMGGVAISFGWSTAGLGKNNGMEIIEILMVPHGGAHYDTLVTVERKVTDTANQRIEAAARGLTLAEHVGGQGSLVKA